MKGLFHLIILTFSINAIAQQVGNYETTYVSEVDSSVAHQGEDGQTPAGEGE